MQMFFFKKWAFLFSIGEGPHFFNGDKEWIQKRLKPTHSIQHLAYKMPGFRRQMKAAGPQGLAEPAPELQQEGCHPSSQKMGG